MNKQKTKKSKWFSLLIGGMSFMVLATSTAQAKELFNEYQISSSGFVVAQNDATNSKMIMKKAMMQTQQQRQKLISQNKNNPIFKGTAGKKRFMMTLHPLSNGQALVTLKLLGPNGKVIGKTMTTVNSNGTLGTTCTTVCKTTTVSCETSCHQ